MDFGISFTCFIAQQVGSSASGGGDMATNMLQKFWDSAMALEPVEDDDDSHRLVCCHM